MEHNKIQISDGKKIKFIGWGILIAALVYSIVGYLDIASDPSTKAFAFLVFIEGGLWMGIGLVAVWIGYRIDKKSSDKNSAAKENRG